MLYCENPCMTKILERQHRDRVEVRFHNGAIADADVVVGGDGIHSTVREAILGPESPRFSGHVAYRGLVPAARVVHLGIEVVASSWLGAEPSLRSLFCRCRR